ncbi:MAG: TetR/AcrR family transcriptional regulator [Lachnospiraceae bacterium]|nr:TetR/AcrR family transcriptional regulator [Lachnospiraceae bacterium]
MAPTRDVDDLRAKKTRIAIRKAFIQLLCETDFNSISIATLMKRANYSRGAFYLHYQNIWDVFEELVREYIKDLCAGFDVERKPDRYNMDEQAYLIVLEVVKAAKSWYPFGKALLNKRRVPDIMPDLLEQYSWERLKEETILFPAVGVKYADAEDEIARETAMRYCVATLMCMFECAALYVTPNMSYSDMTRLAERIYAGNVAYWNYEQHMDLHVVKWHEGLEE